MSDAAAGALDYPQGESTDLMELLIGAIPKLPAILHVYSPSEISHKSEWFHSYLAFMTMAFQETLLWKKTLVHTSSRCVTSKLLIRFELPHPFRHTQPSSPHSVGRALPMVAKTARGSRLRPNMAAWAQAPKTEASFCNIRR